MWIQAEKYTPKDNQEAALAVRENGLPEGALVLVLAIYMDGRWWPIEDGEPSDGEIYPPVFIHPIDPTPRA